MSGHPERQNEDETTDETSVAPQVEGAADEVDIEDDPAYNPQDEGLKDIKGG